MKKILILGAGHAQIDAILYCKKAGLEVHACSYNENDPGRNYVDNYSCLDITDIESICAYVQRNQINLLYSMGSEIAMPTVAAVSERLNLTHFVSFQTAKICQNKGQLRTILDNAWEGNIPFAVIKTKNDIATWPEYPCILKPVDSQGQRGVYLLQNSQDFDEYYPHSLKFSVRKELIVEKYIPGPEISVNVYVYAGQIIFLQSSDRISFDQYPGGIIKEHLIPAAAVKQNLEKKIYNLAVDIIRKLEIFQGPVYFQLKFLQDKPVLLEVTPRLDGCHLWRLIKYFSGIDLLDITFQHLLTNQVNLSYGKNDVKKRYCLKYFCEKPGHAVDRHKYDLQNALYLQWYYQQGELVRPINEYMEKIGYYLSEVVT